MNDFWQSFIQKTYKEGDDVPKEIIYMIKRVVALFSEIQVMSSFAVDVYGHTKEKATEDMIKYFNTKLVIILDFPDIEKYVKFKITSESDNDHEILISIDYPDIEVNKDLAVFLRNVESIYRSALDMLSMQRNQRHLDIMQDDGMRPQYLN
jgi:hypothetical protein